MSPKKKNSKVLCHCLDVTRKDVIKAIAAHKIESLEDICKFTQAGDGCTACHPALQELLKKAGYLASSPPILSVK